jgi:hypothetical protein
VNHYILNEDDCLLANGSFYYTSKTVDECLSYLYCWTPESIVTGILTPLDSMGQCPEGGRIQSLFEWENATWIGGTWAYTNWTSRNFIAANRISMTIDFPMIQSVVSAPSDLSVKTYFQNQVNLKVDRWWISHVLSMFRICATQLVQFKMVCMQSHVHALLYHSMVHGILINLVSQHLLQMLILALKQLVMGFYMHNHWFAMRHQQLLLLMNQH